MKILFLLLALSAVTFARDYPYLWVDEAHDEVVYKYKADIRTLVHDPSFHYSASYLIGDLHIREDKEGNGTVFWFDHVEISAYNGEDSDEWGHHGSHFTKLPKESEAMYMPFYVSYDEFGLVSGVMFMKDEPEWTMNFKKAVASSVQLHVPKLKEAFAHKDPYTFYMTEKTIYGKCKVAYEIQMVKGVEDAWDVYKYFDPKHCSGHFEQMYTNIVPTQCHDDHDDSYRTPTTKVYRIHKKQLEHLHSSGKILMYPFKAQDNLQVVSVNQDFWFKEQIKPVKVIDLKSFVHWFPMTFTKPHTGDHEFVPDYTFGRQHVDVKALIPKVKEMLYEAVMYLRDFSHEAKAPDTKHGLVINRILKVLKHFDIKEYEECLALFKDVKEPKDLLALEMFYKLLPNVGTYPSVMFIKWLIAEHKVKDTVATAMLHTMGVNVHVPSEKMLKELEMFLTWDDKVKPDVYYAGILSYGTIIYETYKDHEDDEHVEKYIKMYYKHLTEAKKYEEQLIWMQGLCNIRIGSVYKLLKPIVLGEPVFKYDRHLRVHAIWNIYHPLVDHHVDAFDTFWPIVVDGDLHIELRVAALKTIMRTANMSELYYIFQYMMHEHCPHLYHFFYTGVKSLANSEIYCDRRANLTAFAEQVEQYFQNSPVDVGTSVWVRDYVDKEYDVGMIVYGNTIANEKTNEINQIFMKFDSYMSNHFFNNFAIHIKFEGIESPVESWWSGLLDFDVDYFKSARLFKKTGEPIHFEITVTHHEQVVFSKYFDESSLKNFFTADFFKLLSMLKYQFLNIHYIFQGEVNVPTDIGWTAQFYSYIPTVSYFKSEVPMFEQKDKEMTFKTNKFFRIWRHGTYGVNIYNPFAAMTQGVRRVYALDFNLPLHYEIHADYQHDIIKINGERMHDDVMDYMGYKTYVTTQVISVPDKGFDLLHQTCKDCDQYVMVTKGKDYRHDVEFFDVDAELWGRHYHFGAYDCEYSVYDLHHHHHGSVPFSHDYWYELGHVPLKKFLVHTLQWFAKNAYFYPKGSCGLMLIGKPMKNIEKVEFVFKFDKEHHHDDEKIHHPEFHHIVVPHEKHELEMEFITKDKDDHIMSEWEGEIEFKHGDGNLFTWVDMHWSHMSNKSDEILNWCLTREKDYEHEKISGEYNFWWGYSHKRECVKDDFFITVHMDAGFSEEQKQEVVHKDKEYTYTDCMAHVPWKKVKEVTYDCMYAHTSLRHYTYDIHFDHVPTSWQWYFKNIWHFMKVAYGAEYNFEGDEFTYKKDMKVDIVYPIAYKDPIAHVTVNHKDQSYVFEEFPVSKFWWFSQPESYDIPMYLRWAKYLNEYHVCNIVPMKGYHSLPHHFVAEMPTHDWHMYASNDHDNATWSLYVQKPEKDETHLAVKFIINDHWIVLKPLTEKEQTKYGDTQYTAMFDPRILKYFAGNYVDEELHGLRMFTVHHTIFFAVPEYGMLWAYDGEYVRVVTLDVDHDKFKFYGKCYV